MNEVMAKPLGGVREIECHSTPFQKHMSVSSTELNHTWTLAQEKRPAAFLLFRSVSCAQFHLVISSHQFLSAIAQAPSGVAVSSAFISNEAPLANSDFCLLHIEVGAGRGLKEALNSLLGQQSSTV